MSIYDLEFLEHQEFAYKVYGENLVKKQEVYNAWTFTENWREDLFISNEVLNIKIKASTHTNDSVCRNYIKNLIIGQIPNCFFENKSSHSTVALNKFLKYVGLSEKFIWKSLKKRVLDQFQDSFGKDVLNLKMWKVTEMLDFWLSPGPYEIKKLSVNQQAVYVSLYTVGMQNKLWLLDDLFCFEEYSKSRLFKRVGRIYQCFDSTYILNKRNRSLLSEAFNLLLNIPEKEFQHNVENYTYFYNKLAQAKLVCENYYFYDNLEVINKEKEKEFFAKNSSPRIGWSSRYSFFSLECYEEEKENFLHIYLLYKDAGCDLDDYILDNFPVIKALFKTLGKEKALGFLNKQKKVTGVPF